MRLFKEKTYTVVDNDGEELYEDSYVRDYDDLEEYYDDNWEEKPECCIACGGPYPHCVDSCSLFDD